MKSILMATPGTPEVLSLADVPAPAIAYDTELLVRLKKLMGPASFNLSIR